MREGIIAKALLPLRFVLLILPSFAVRRQNLGGGFAKGRDDLRLPALEKRVQPDRDLTADFPRSLAGVGGADLGGAAHTEVPAVARLLYAAHTALAASRLHDEIEAVTIEQTSVTGSLQKATARKPYN